MDGECYLVVIHIRNLNGAENDLRRELFFLRWKQQLDVVTGFRGNYPAFDPDPKALWPVPPNG